ncbi:hypothetical protein ACP275_06G201300 [Erythranthe tilingii]
MKDEQGDVGPAGGGGGAAAVVSLSPLSGKLVGEPLVESMGGENLVEESYEEGYGGEIMVEIVGSDVFVGGVRGHKEGYLGSEEVGNFKDHAWQNGEENPFSDGMDVWDEEIDVCFNESVDLQNGGEVMDVRSSKEVVEEKVCPSETEIVQTDSVMFDDPAVKTEARLDIVVEDYEFPQSKEQVFEVQITESEFGIEEHKPEFPDEEYEGIFAISDMVWGKIRNHPWWPGQVFDPEHASDKAVQYYKKDSYLVAYFGDGTFSWSNSSVLRPFRSYFPQIEKQSNSEAFQSAVDSALEEVSRRVELGLACSCIPEDAYRRIEAQVVENTGIREESCRRYGVDHSSRASFFEPDKLLDYVRNLATHASSSCGADRVDLVILRGQLSAFSRYKGYRLPTEFLESDENISDEVVGPHRDKHTPEDDSCSRKERSLMELMDDDVSSGRKQRSDDPLTNGSGKRVNGQTHKPSFRIGDCVSRVASQLTQSTSSVKGNSVETVIDENRGPLSSTESFSVNKIVSQLQTVAQKPEKENGFENSTRTFFSGFRNSVVLNQRGRKRKAESAIGEEFDFGDAKNDSYWTDRIVHTKEEQTLPYIENPVVKQSGIKSQSRKRFSGGTHSGAAMELDDCLRRRKQESSPAELILNFADKKCVPSEINLNKIFRRFGTLMESETEVDRDLGQAKVIFKRGADAVIAHDSSEKFNIFGPVIVTYEIGYSPLISVKVLPLEIPQFPEDDILML